MALFLLVDDESNKVSSDAIYCLFINPNSNTFFHEFNPKIKIQLINRVFNAGLYITQSIVHQSTHRGVSVHNSMSASFASYFGGQLSNSLLHLLNHISSAINTDP